MVRQAHHERVEKDFAIVLGLDPVALLSSIREAQSAMAAMSSPQLQETPHRESIDRFLARLPSLWQQGEARPTHKARVRPPRHWRTRKDPFKACGATCCCGCRKTQIPTPRTCWQNYARPIRAGSEMLICERCSAE